MSASNPRTMTEFDLRRLDALAQRVRDRVKPPGSLSPLERELAQAISVKPEEIPATIVTMNVAWLTPRGPRQLKVERIVFQPEAAGRFDL